MPTISEQLTSAVKANAESQHAITAALGDKVFERLEEFTRLNMDAVKAALAESTATAKELLQAQNPQEFFLASAAHLKRDSQNTIFYGSEATRIASAIQTECSKAAAEKIAEANRNGTALLTELTKNVPAATEQIVNILKSAMGMVNAGDEFVKKTRDEAATVDDQLAAAAHQASRKKQNNQTGSTTH